MRRLLFAILFLFYRKIYFHDLNLWSLDHKLSTFSLHKGSLLTAWEELLIISWLFSFVLVANATSVQAGKMLGKVYYLLWIVLRVLLLGKGNAWAHGFSPKWHCHRYQLIKLSIVGHGIKKWTSNHAHAIYKQHVQ